MKSCHCMDFLGTYKIDGELIYGVTNDSKAHLLLTSTAPCRHPDMACSARVQMTLYSCSEHEKIMVGINAASEVNSDTVEDMKMG